MRRIVIAWLLFCSAAFAQVGQIPGWPPNKPFIAAGGYTGPGDLTLSVGTARFWFGLRAYSAAQRGTKIANVCNSTGGTDVGCADMLSDATTGDLVPATISGIPCPGTNCTVKVLYDQSGTNFCTGGTVPCNLTQATVANRPALSTTCGGTLTAGRPCMVFVKANSTQFPVGLTTSSVTQPVTMNVVVIETTHVSDSGIAGFSGGTGGVLHFPTSGNVEVYWAGTGTATKAATFNSWHSLIGVISTSANGAFMNVDNVNGTTQTFTGGAAGTGQIRLGVDFFSNFLDGNIVEFAYYQGAFTSTSAGTDTALLCHNQFAYWGTATSC